jgi:hypothetical protein
MNQRPSGFTFNERPNYGQSVALGGYMPISRRRYGSVRDGLNTFPDAVCAMGTEQWSRQPHIDDTSIPKLQHA